MIIHRWYTQRNIGGWRYSGYIISNNSRVQTGAWFVFSMFYCSLTFGVKPPVRHFECDGVVSQLASGCVAPFFLLTMWLLEDIRLGWWYKRREPVGMQAVGCFSWGPVHQNNLLFCISGNKSKISFEKWAFFQCDNLVSCVLPLKYLALL